MFQNVPIKHQLNFNGQKITLETGLLATQATSSVTITCGGTTLLIAVVVGKEGRGDYFPLQVIYEEKMYASGKIKSSLFNKREGRPNDKAILIGRMVDRSLRSLFDPNIRTEIQIIITTLSLDLINHADTLAVLGASTALNLCGFELQTEKNAHEDTGADKSMIIGREPFEGEALRKIAKAVVFNPRTQKYLVINWKNIGLPDNVFCVGGGIDEGETELGGLIREIKEETGYTNFSQIIPLDGTIINTADNANEFKSKLIYPFLVILKDETQTAVKLEQGEIDKGLTVEWLNSSVIKERFDNPLEVKFSSAEIFKRGIAKTIQLGLDTLSNPQDWQYSFTEENTTSVFRGPVAAVRVGLIETDSIVSDLVSDRGVSFEELKLETLNNSQTLDENWSKIEDFVKHLDLTDMPSIEKLNQISKTVMQVSPQYAIKLKNTIQKRQENKITENSQGTSKTVKAKQLIVNPTHEQMINSELDLLVSGNGDNIVMLEAGANIIDELIINEALDKAMPELDKLVNFQNEFIQMCK